MHNLEEKIVDKLIYPFVKSEYYKQFKQTNALNEGLATINKE